MYIDNFPFLLIWYKDKSLRFFSFSKYSIYVIIEAAEYT